MKHRLFLSSLCLPAGATKGNHTQTYTDTRVRILYIPIPPRFTSTRSSLFPVCSLGYHIHQVTYGKKQ